ncbi:MAG TPA: hypothetical protein VI893_04310 [Thermoplasmata archaeon]|nr:hypothetical protein [Thermoplasmata archaeon]
MNRRPTVWSVRATILISILAIVPTSSLADPDPLCLVFITPGPGFGVVEIAIDLVLNQSELLRLMQMVDWNDDLTIDASEVSNYETATVSQISWSTYDEFEALGEKKLLLDDQPPSWLTTRFDLKKFEGPVDPERNVTVTEVREYPFSRYSDVEPPSHRLVGGDKAHWNPRPGVETAIISSPPGWWVWSVNGTGIRETSVTIKGFDYKGLFTIVYAKQGMTPEGKKIGWETEILMYTLIALVPVVAIGITVFALARKKERREQKPVVDSPLKEKEKAATRGRNG